MSRWHTDRQEQATGGRAHLPSVSVGQLAAAGREGLASSLSRQSGAVWLLAFALAILAHVLMTVWLMMTVSPQTGTQQPAAVSMLFEAPRAPLSAASQAEADKTASQQQTQPLPTMKDMPDMDAASLGREMPEVLPPSVRPEADHLPQVPALPKKWHSNGPPCSMICSTARRRFSRTPSPRLWEKQQGQHVPKRMWPQQVGKLLRLPAPRQPVRRGAFSYPVLCQRPITPSRPGIFTRRARPWLKSALMKKGRLLLPDWSKAPGMMIWMIRR